jgi:hypothetical protein
LRIAAPSEWTNLDSTTTERRTRRPLLLSRRGRCGITSVYLQGIDNAEIIETVHARRAPMIPVSASLRP